MHFTPMAAQAGLVYRPGVTRLRCGKGGDSGGHCGHPTPYILHLEPTSYILHLTGGGSGGHCGWWCPSTTALGDVSRWDYPGDGCGGSWQVSDFGIFLRRQAAWQRRNQRLQYNEIIVDGDECTRQLPWCVGAFFFVAGHAAARAQAQRQHAAFLAEYPSVTGRDVPLVALDLHDWVRPFRRAG